MAHIRKKGPRRWQVRYRDPTGMERARNFRRRIDAERFLVTIEADKVRGSWTDPRLARTTVETLVEYDALTRQYALLRRTQNRNRRDEGPIIDFDVRRRTHSLEEATQLDTVILDTARTLFRKNWKRPRPIRLLGVHVSGLQQSEGQLDLIEGTRKKKWSRALRAVDGLRDRFGESAVGLAAAMKHGRKERVHENPAGLPGGRGESKEDSDS